MPSYGIRKRRRPARESTVPRRPSRLRYLVRVPCGTGRSGARPDPAVELLQNRLAVLVALLVVADHPELLGGEAGDLTGDLVGVQAVVVLDREPRLPQALLGVGEGDVEELGVGAHDLLGHLLACLLLALYLFGERLQHPEPMLPGLLRRLLHRVHALLCHIRSLLVGLTSGSVVPVLGRTGMSTVLRP